MFAEPSTIDQRAHSTNGDGGPDSHGQVDTSVGLILILLGAFLLGSRAFGPNLWHWFWPFLIAAPGALFLAAAFAFGRSVSGLAIPGSITTTVGLLLLFSNFFQAWQVWAYAWTLVVPTSIGVGLFLYGALSGRSGAQRTGRVMATIGLWLFVGFAALFEGVLHISGTLGTGITGPGIGAALVVGGLFFLTQRTETSASF
jgi:hypothetical protein